MPPIRTITPGGIIVTETPSAAYSGSLTEVTVFQDLIKADAMSTNKTLSLILDASMTSGLSVGTYSVRVYLGSTSLAIVNSLGIVALQTNQPFEVDLRICNKTSGSQFVKGKVQQIGTTPIALTSPIYVAHADWSVDTTSDQILKVTVQSGGIILGQSLTVKRINYEIS